MAGCLVDISQTLTAGLPGWPGGVTFVSEPIWSHTPGCPMAMSRYEASTPAGTGTDAPLHYDPAEAATDAVRIDAVVGPARVLDLRGRGQVITPDMVAAASGGPQRVLLRTCHRFPHDTWSDKFATLDADTMRVLAAHGVVLVRIDSPSVDPREAKVLRAHEAARVTRMRLLEGLVLDDVAAGDYEPIALPIRPGGLDAAPARAVLRSSS